MNITDILNQANCSCSIILCCKLGLRNNEQDVIRDEIQCLESLFICPLIIYFKLTNLRISNNCVLYNHFWFLTILSIVFRKLLIVSIGKEEKQPSTNWLIYLFKKTLVRIIFRKSQRGNFGKEGKRPSTSWLIYLYRRILARCCYIISLSYFVLFCWTQIQLRIIFSFLLIFYLHTSSFYFICLFDFFPLFCTISLCYVVWQITAFVLEFNGSAISILVEIYLQDLLQKLLWIVLCKNIWWSMHPKGDCSCGLS